MYHEVVEGELNFDTVKLEYRVMVRLLFFESTLVRSRRQAQRPVGMVQVAFHGEISPLLLTLAQFRESKVSISGPIVRAEVSTPVGCSSRWENNSLAPLLLVARSVAATRAASGSDANSRWAMSMVLEPPWGM